jgi:phytoene synthase
MTELIAAPKDIAAANLGRSRAFCAEVTRTQAKNFYYGLKLLPPEKRDGMFALYAFMRYADDLADDAMQADVKDRISQLEKLRTLTHQALADHRPPDHPWGGWPAFVHCVQRFNMPVSIFDAMIDGQLQDLGFKIPETFEDLSEYCYRVAGVVGLASIHVWGYTGGHDTERLALDRGTAFQLTNVLRDVREDARRGRCYIPMEDLTRFGVRSAWLGNGLANNEILSLLNFEISRARKYFHSAADLEQYVSADCRPALAAMTGIYRGILDKIAYNPMDVLTRRVRLNSLHKLLIMWRSRRG